MFGGVCKTRLSGVTSEEATGRKVRRRGGSSTVGDGIAASVRILAPGVFNSVPGSSWSSGHPKEAPEMSAAHKQSISWLNCFEGAEHCLAPLGWELGLSGCLSGGFTGEVRILRTLTLGKSRGLGGGILLKQDHHPATR